MQQRNSGLLSSPDLKTEDGLSVLAFRNEPALQYVFAKFNTGVPSSASVERMFSMGKDVLRAKRATLSESGSGTSSIKGEGGGTGFDAFALPFFFWGVGRAGGGC